MGMFFITLQQTIILFLMMMTGYVVLKTGVVKKEAVSYLNAIIVNVSCPAAILNALQSDAAFENSTIFIGGMGLAILTHVVFIILSFIFIRGKDSSIVGIERCTLIFCNAAFMGIPLLSALYGDIGTIYAAFFVMTWNLFFWTIGINILKPDATMEERIHNLMSPNIFALVIAILLYVLNIRLPYVFAKTVGYLAGTATPLPMMAIGMTLVGMDFVKAINWKVLYLCALKLLVFPFILLVLFRLTGLMQYGGQYIIVLAACPTAAMISMLAQRANPDEKVSVPMVTISTVFSIITLAVVAAL